MVNFQPLVHTQLQIQMLQLLLEAETATDYMKAFADGIRPFIPRGRIYKALGTDGYGRSDTREQLRHFFEVNRYFVAIAALKALAEDGAIEAKVVGQAIAKYGIDPAKPDPMTV